MKSGNVNPLFKVSKNLSMTSLDLLGTLFLEYVTNLGQSSSPKLELVFQIYAITGSIIILTVKAQFAHVVLKMKHRFIFFLCCPRYTTQRSALLSKISDIIDSDVSVIPNEHLYHILVHGSNVYNSVSNGLILAESITYIRKSGQFPNLEAFG